jgi:hypothetical protein
MRGLIPFVLAVLVGALFLTAVTSHAQATDYAQQRVVERVIVKQQVQKVIVPQKVIVREQVYVPVQVQAFNDYGGSQQNFIRQQSRSRQFSNLNVQRSFQSQRVTGNPFAFSGGPSLSFNSFSSRQSNTFGGGGFPNQQFNSAGNSSSFSFQSSRSSRSGGFFRNILPF